MTHDFACDGHHGPDAPCNEVALDRLVEKLRPVIREEVRKASLGARFSAARQKADAGRDVAREAVRGAAKSLAEIQEARPKPPTGTYKPKPLPSMALQRGGSAND